MKIAAFFKSAPTSATTSEEVKTTASNAHLQRVEVVAEENPIQMTVNLKVEMPDIILVEHMDNEDTNAMIMNVSYMRTINNSTVVKEHLFNWFHVVTGNLLCMKNVLLGVCYLSLQRYWRNYVKSVQWLHFFFVRFFLNI